MPGAFPHLLQVSQVAILTTIRGVVDDAAISLALATALVTGVPLLPVAQAAVGGRLAAARLSRALLGDMAGAYARLATKLRLDGYLPLAILHATTALRGARAPSLPRAPFAILGVLVYAA